METLAIVNTPAPRARQYFQYRPTPVVLAADPDVQTHRAFGLRETALLPDDTDPRQVHWPQSATMAQLLKTSISAADELPPGMNLFAAGDALNAKDGFEMTEEDQHWATVHPTQTAGRFLIDAAGTIRWTFVEAPDSPNQTGRLPRDEDIVAVARAVHRH